MSLDKILKSRGLLSMKEYSQLVNSSTYISTGYPELDEAIHPITDDCPNGGGFPTGAITEVFGMPATGKSRFVKDVCLRPELKSLYIDTENSLPADEFNYLSQHCDVISENVLENIWGIVNDCVAERLYNFIVVDSIAATTTNAELANDTEQTMSSQLAKSKVMTSWLKPLVGLLRGSNCAVVFVNHKKIAPGVVPKVYTPGGSMLPFLSTVRLDFSAPKSKLRHSDSGSTQGVEVKIAKSRSSQKDSIVSIKIKLGNN